MTSKIGKLAPAALLGIVLLAACQKAPETASPKAETPALKTLAEIRSAHDWANEPGATLNTAFATDVAALFKDKTRDDIQAAITEAGYDCMWGEAHEDYPVPSAQCTTSFATRACQMDWEIFVTTDQKTKVSTSEGSYKRDCVGRDNDYPEPIDSAIDDQLAPAPSPTEPSPEETSPRP